MSNFSHITINPADRGAGSFQHPETNTKMLSYVVSNDRYQLDLYFHNEDHIEDKEEPEFLCQTTFFTNWSSNGINVKDYLLNMVDILIRCSYASHTCSSDFYSRFVGYPDMPNDLVETKGFALFMSELCGSRKSFLIEDLPLVGVWAEEYYRSLKFLAELSTENYHGHGFSSYADTHKSLLCGGLLVVDQEQNGVY